jgi:hypothetical protein
MRGGSKLYWTKARCIRSASYYPNRGAWIKKSPSAYTSAYLRGWLDECCGHMVRLRLPRVSWTKKQCREIAKNYATGTQWAKEHNRSYCYAYRKGWLKECMRHMPPPRASMSLKQCKREIKKFRTRKQWRQDSPRSYSAARRLGIFRKYFKKDKWYRRYYAEWNHDKLIKFARRFKSRTEWHAKSCSTYAAAKLQGCFEQCCAHMG